MTYADATISPPIDASNTVEPPADAPNTPAASNSTPNETSTQPANPIPFTNPTPNNATTRARIVPPDPLTTTFLNSLSKSDLKQLMSQYYLGPGDDWTKEIWAVCRLVSPTFQTRSVDRMISLTYTFVEDYAMVSVPECSTH